MKKHEHFTKASALCEKSEGNILPLLSDAAWHTETPPTKSIAHFSKGELDSSLDITLSSSSYGVGKWVCDFSLAPSKTYHLTGSCITACQENDVFFIYTLFDKDGNMIFRDHATDCVRCGECLLFGEIIDAPKEVVKGRIEMWLKGNFASVRWLQPRLCEIEPLPERKARVSIAYIEPDHGSVHTIDENIDIILKTIDKSAEYRPDLIVLSEGMDAKHTGIPLKDHAEDLQTGRICSLVRKKAAEHSCYIVYNFHEIENGEYYNTSALFGREGEICGKYRKTHLTVTELESGLTPGDAYPVFDTDFGKLGMLICWDHYFSEPAEEIVKSGAEIVAVSSAGDSNAKGIARAMDGGVWYAIAGWNTNNCYGWGPGRIVAPDGEIVAHTSKNFEPANYEIDLNKKIRIEWLAMGPAMSHAKAVYRYQKHHLGKEA